MAVEFSLVIPTLNRAEALEMTLQCLSKLQYPRNAWEVLVVDDGSQDQTPEILARFVDVLPLRYWSQANRGAGAARNRAIREARGLFVLFVDDDVLVPEDLLHLHRESHGIDLKRLVRGPVINFATLPPPPPPAQLWKHFSMNYLCTSNASLRREALLEAGLFDESLERWEDAELGVRLKGLGIKRIWNSQAYVLHYKPPASWESRCLTAARDGRSAALLYLRYPSPRMWLRSGLHRLNDWRNRACLHSDWLQKLPGGSRMLEDLRLERIYLDHGKAALSQAKNPRESQPTS